MTSKPFRYLPHATLATVKVWQSDSTSHLFWWVREWPLPDLQQKEKRRSQRWAKTLEAASWDIEAPNVFWVPSTLSVQRQHQREQKGAAISNSQQAVDGITSESFTEQSMRTDCLLFLLCRALARSKDSRAAKSLEHLLSYSINFEVSIFGAACPVLDGLWLDISVMHLLASTPACGHRICRKVASKWPRLQHIPFIDFLNTFSTQLPQLFFTDLANVIEQTLQHKWATLPTDPLAANRQATHARQRSARMDPDLQAALTEVVLAGPKAVDIANRALSNHLFHRKKPEAPCRLVLNEVGCYLQALTTVMATARPARIAIANDASRRGGFKVLLSALMSMDTLACAFPVPQAMRDFRAGFTSCGLMDLDTALDCLLGMRTFLWGKGRVQQELNSGSTSHTAAHHRRPERMAAYDLGLALENMLQQSGFTLSNFMFAT